MKIIIFVLATLWFFTITCSNFSKPEIGLTEIDISKMLKEQDTSHLSNFVDTIEYIKLETNDNCIISDLPRFYVDEDNIISVAFRQIFLFDRETGKFIREIGKYGRGPDEYMSTIGSYGESYKKISTLLGNNHFLLYDLVGNDNKRIKIKSNIYTAFFDFLPDNCFLGYTPNLNGHDSTWAQIFNSNGQVLKTFKNFQYFDDNPKLVRSFGLIECFFYHFESKLHIKQFSNDTIYYLDGTTLHPKYVFKIGENAIPYSKRDERDFDLNNYCYVSKIYESKDLLFFEIQLKGEIYPSFYDKRRSKVHISHENSYSKSGFINNLDGFLPFYPQYINNKGEMVDFANAVSVNKWFENSANSSKITLEKLKKLKETSPEDNPIIMLARLKQ